MSEVFEPADDAGPAAMLATRVTEAVAAGDSEAFVGLFADDGEVDDWGRVFSGPAAIRTWSDAEFIGAAGRMQSLSGRVDGDDVVLTAQWVSTRHTGPSLFRISPRGHRIGHFVIREA